jgi:hypothetical protein
MMQCGTAKAIVIYALLILSVELGMRASAQTSLNLDEQKKQWQRACDRGKLERVNDRNQQAATEYKQALTLAQPLGLTSYEVQWTLLQIAETLVASHQVTYAAAYCERELTIFKKLKAEHIRINPEILVSMNSLADAFEKESKTGAQLLCLNYCVEFRLESEANPTRIANAYFNLAEFCLEQKAYAPCEGMSGQAIKWYYKNFGTNQERIIDTWLNMAEAAEMMGQFSKSEGYIAQAQSVSKKSRVKLKHVSIDLHLQELRVAEKEGFAWVQQQDKHRLPGPRNISKIIH